MICPTRLPLDDAAIEIIDDNITGTRLGVSIEAVSTDRYDIIFTDGMTLSVTRTNDNDHTRGERPEPDGERMLRILDSPGIFRRMDELMFNDFTNTDPGPSNQENVSWLWDRLDSELFRDTWDGMNGGRDYIPSWIMGWDRRRTHLHPPAPSNRGVPRI